VNTDASFFLLDALDKPLDGQHDELALCCHSGIAYRRSEAISGVPASHNPGCNKCYPDHKNGIQQPSDDTLKARS